MKNAVGIGFLLVAILTTGCAQHGQEIVTTAAATSEDTQRELQQLRDSYYAGNYGDVIRGAAHATEIEAAAEPLRIEAFKLLAFSYCLSGYPTQCQEQFERILVIDPDYRLSTAEQGHPQWGPAFKAALGK